MHRLKDNACWQMVLLILLGWSLLVAAAQAANSYDLSWYSVDDGGGYVSGGFYRLFGVVGQPDAGRLAGGQYTLEGGFLNGSIDGNNAAQNWCLYE